MKTKELLYTNALKMIKNGSYLEAYNNLKICKDYKDCKELLLNFKVVYDKKICTKYAGTEKIYSTTTYEYDKKGNLIIKIHATADDEIRQEFTYGNDGRLLSESLFGSNKEVYKTEYAYDENGNRICENRIKKEIYDKNGNIILTIRFGVFSQIICKTEYTYNQYGDEIFLHEYDDQGKLIAKTEQEYKYDTNGNIIQKSCYLGITEKELLYQYRYEYKYNEYNLKTSEIVYYSEGIAMAHNNSLVGEGFHYEKEEIIENMLQYKYDDYGNVKCINEFDSEKNIKVITEFEYINPRVVYKF